MAHLYADYYQKRYKMRCCSCVSLFWFLALIVAVALPYYLCWVSKGELESRWSGLGFWEKQVTYFEQPNVDFEGSIVISYLDNKGRSNTFSNILELNQKFEQDWEAGVPTITVEKTKDANNKLTNIKLKVDLAGVDPSTVTKVQVLSSFRYELRENLNLDMIGLLNAEVES
jgi:hypothetical protein